MIEKMKVVSIVAQASQKDALLDGLKKLGLLHIREKQCADPACLQRIADLSATELALQEYAPETLAQDLLSDDDFETLYQGVKAALENRQALSTQRAALVARAEALEKWGSFSPQDFDFLRSHGLDLHIYRMDKKTLSRLQENKDVPFLRLLPGGKNGSGGAVVAPPRRDLPPTSFRSPPRAWTISARRLPSWISRPPTAKRCSAGQHSSCPASGHRS